MNENYAARIDRVNDEEFLYQSISDKYDLGNITSHQLIEIGYEDYNEAVDSEKGRYFLKVFSNGRSDEMAADLAKRVAVAVEAGIATPKIYSNRDDEIVSRIDVGDARFRLILTDYIDGQDFYSLGQPPTDDELSQIVQIAADLQKIDYQPPFVYDSWAITSFADEFAKKRDLLEPKYLDMVQPIYENFIKFDFDALPKGYTHGDIIVTNLVKDADGKIWLVDYSVANYTARLNEIAVICCDLAMLTGDAGNSRRRIKQTFDKWCEKVGATDFEKQSFPLLFNAANAMHVMNAAAEKSAGNETSENQYFLDAGVFGLGLDIGVEK